MKTATTPISNKLKQSVEVINRLQLIAEWNMNRYAPITSITNGNAGSPTADADPDIFPIESIADPIRPKKSGLVKARASAPATAAIGGDGKTSPDYVHYPNGPRYVSTSPDSKYKYWQSPTESAGSVYAISAASISSVQPTIIYTANTWTNKIVIGIENTYTQPSAWTVEITTDGAAWTTIATNPTIPTNGRVELYRQAGGTWSSTVYRDNPMQIRGVRINVTQMNKAKVYFSLIELGARIESDLSQFVSDFSLTQEMSDHSFVAPLGKASANQGSVTLANFDGRFTNTNSSSMYYGLIDKNVEMRLDVGLTTDTYTTVSKTWEYIRMLTMYTDYWGEQGYDTIDVPLQDATVILQQIKPLPALYQSMTTAEIIWRLLDSIGFSDFFVEAVDADPATVVPYFWVDGEKTVWECITELTEQTQTAAWFDEYGILQIKTRTTALNLAKTSTWTFQGAPTGGDLTNIASLKKVNDYEANIVNVFYQDTKISDETRGVIPMEVVWEPDGDLVLRSTKLGLSMTTTSTSMRIVPTDAKTWPYTGIVQVEGEFIKYIAKGYSYYNAAGTLVSKYIDSEDDKVALDKLNASKSFMNYFNGYLNIGTTANRGVWSSVPKAHNVDASGWTAKYRTGNATVFTSNFGWRQVPDLGVARMNTNNTFKSNSWYTATRGAEGDAANRYYGTRFRFLTTAQGYPKGCFGLAMSCGGSGDAGYYLEVYQTANFVGYPTGRSVTQELAFYVRYADGSTKRVAGTGIATQILQNVWYDLDVQVTYGAGGSPSFVVMLNGVVKWTFTVPAVNMPPTGNTGRWGMFLRGPSAVDIEYAYATNHTESVKFDEATIYDRIRKGFSSNQRDVEWIYNTRTAARMSGKKKVYYTQRFNSFFMDEFGAGVHEVREMDVKFEKPVLHSQFYTSNDTQSICSEYVGNVWGSKFVIANTSRINAILNGTDSVMFGADNPVEQKTVVYGRTITQEDEKKVTARNDSAVRRRGEVATDIGGQWIQSKAAAQKLADWVGTHWAGGADEIEIETFCNPLLQLGDVVSVNYAPSQMTAATHKYFVVRIDTSYNMGLETTVTLRRARI